MSVGITPGNQLNLIVFEVGILTTFDGQRGARTICVHPLVVVPTLTTFTDATRTAVQQTTYGVLKVPGGRRLRMISLSRMMPIRGAKSASGSMPRWMV